MGAAEGLRIYWYPRTAYRGIPEGTPVDCRDLNGITPLFAAVFAEDEPTVDHLLSQGADPNAIVPRDRPFLLRFCFSDGPAMWKADARGWTALHMAMYRSNRPMGERLLEVGADPNVQAEDGRTPLMVLVQPDLGFWHPETVLHLTKLLLTHGAALELKDSWGKTVLDYASDFPNRDLVRLLLEHGAHLTLAAAAYLGDAEACRRLLVDGVDVNSADRNGWTPLHHAAYEGHLPIIRLLLQNGSDPRIKNRAHQTPAEVARYKNSEVEALLREAEENAAVIEPCR